jgi:hypothetical protein
MKRIISSGDCEHCEGKVIYENDHFKVEMTKRGIVFDLYGGCSKIEAADTYHAWLQERDKSKGKE